MQSYSLFYQNKSLILTKLSVDIIKSAKYLINARPTKPFFVTWFTKGGGYHSPYELELDRPKVCLFGTMV